MIIIKDANNDEVIAEDDLLTVAMLTGLAARAEVIMSRDLTSAIVKRALIRLVNDATLLRLFDKAASVATVAEFEVSIKEAPAE